MRSDGCYLCEPDDPTADGEACEACDREFWRNPVLVVLDEGDLTEGARSA